MAPTPLGSTVSAPSRRRNKDADLQDGVKLNFRHGFGVHGPIRDNVLFVSAESDTGAVKESLLYPLGQHLCLHYLDDNSMSFFTGSPSNVKAILGLSMSPSKRLVAVCEKGGEGDGAQCSVYLLKTRNRIKTLIYPTKGAFTTCCFTGDSKTLITVSAGAERNIIIWDWMSQKQKMTIPLLQQVVTRVASPLNCVSGTVQLTTSGPNHLRMWTIQGDQNAVKPTPLFKEHDNFTDHIWLSLDAGMQRMAAITEGGMSGDGTTRSASVILFQSIAEPPYLEHRRTMTVLLRGSTKVQTIAKSSRGFILGGTNGLFSVYEKTSDRKDPYMHIKSFYIPQESFSSLTVSATDEHVVCLSTSPPSSGSGSRLVSFPLGAVDVMAESDAAASIVPVSPGGLHSGSVIALSTCLQKPYVASVGSDRTLRIWNYVKWTCELTHEFKGDEPSAVALHPSGNQLLVGLRERVRLYNIMFDTIKLFREIPIKNCRELQFSNGGQMFAATMGITIFVYSTYGYSVQSGMQQLYAFTGHLSPVKRVLWSPDDTFMYTAGMDGNVYGWDLIKNQRNDDVNMNRNTSFTGLVAEFPNKESKYHRVAVCGTDGTEGDFCELSWQDDKKDSHDLKIISCGSTLTDYVTSLSLSNNKKFLFAGTSGGNVKTFDWPLDSEKPLFKECRAHQPVMVGGNGNNAPTMRGITAMECTADDNYLITTAEDGTVFVIALQIMERGYDTRPNLEPDSRQFNNDAVFVSVDEVDERKEVVVDLQKKLAELKTENEYHLHDREKMFEKEVKELQDEREKSIQAERNRYDNLMDEFAAYKRQLREKLEIEESNHVQVTQELENQYEHKLAVEMERFDRLAEEIEAMQQKCEGLLEAQAVEHEKMTRLIEQKASKQEKSLNVIIHRMKEDAEHNEKMYREVLDQQEDEYEMELQKLMAVAESELKTEKDATREKQAFVQNLYTKRAQLKKKNEELKTRSQHHENEYAKEKARRDKLEETLTHIELHMKEREDALSDKEKTILKLRSTNRTLDNFRYVLDHRLQQLMKERGPIAKHIEGLEKHVRAMYDELVTEFSKKREMDRVQEQKQLKISTQDKEIVGIRNQLRDSERELHSIKRELTSMVGVTVPKELETIVKDAYRKFVRGETDVKAKSVKTVKKSTAEDHDDDSGDEGGLYGGGGGGGGSKRFSVDEVELAEKAMEAQRQTKWVQKTADDLKRRLNVENKASGRNQRNKLTENTSLIGECNELRRENVSLKRDKDELTHELSDIKERARRKKILAAERESHAESLSLMGSVASAVPETVPVQGTQMKVSQSLAELNRGKTIAPSSSNKTMPNIGEEEGGGLFRGSRSRGQGTALKTDNLTLQKKLDERQRETEMQRIEITKLRESIRLLAKGEGKKDVAPLVQPGSSSIAFRNLEEGSGLGVNKSKLIVNNGASPQK